MILNSVFINISNVITIISILVLFVIFILLFFIKSSVKKTDTLVGQIIKSIDSTEDSKLHFYRLKNNYKSGKYCNFSKGRIFINHFDFKHKYYHTHLLASPTEPHMWCAGHFFNEMKNNNQLEEIEFKDVLKLEPHWNMEFYNLLHKYPPFVFHIL